MLHVIITQNFSRISWIAAEKPHFRHSVTDLRTDRQGDLMSIFVNKQCVPVRTHTSNSFIFQIVIFSRKCICNRCHLVGPAPAVRGQLSDPQPGRCRPSCGPAGHAPGGCVYGKFFLRSYSIIIARLRVC